MDYYAGIDVSLKESSICVVDRTGNVVREVKVASKAEVLIGYFDELELPVGRIGLEAGHCRNGCMPRFWPPGAMRFCWRRGT